MEWFDGSFYVIKSRLNGFVLDLLDNNQVPGAALGSYSMNGEYGSANQQWRITSNGLIKSRLNDFVVDISGSVQAPGTPLISFPVNGEHGTPNQQWELVPVPDTPYFLIKSKLAGLVMDISNSNPALKAQVIAFPTNGEYGTPNQQWELVAVLEPGAINNGTGENTGSTGTQPTSTGLEQVGPDVLKYGEKVHLLNGYAAWKGGYLDVYDRLKGTAGKHGVYTAESHMRHDLSGTWMIQSATGKADGTGVLSGDVIRLFSMFETGGGYLDTNGHADAPELYNVSTAEWEVRKFETTGHKTLDWVVLAGPTGTAIRAGDPINLHNEYNNSQGGFLDVCGAFQGQGGKTKGYNVYTTKSPDRDSGSGYWQFLRSKVEV